MPATAPPVAQSGRRPTNLPWILSSDLLGEDRGAFAVGGIVIVAKAGAALNIGDAVYISAAGVVNKSTTAGNRLFRCGVVVGPGPRSLQEGTKEVIQRLADVGLQAAATDDPVLVCILGLCYAVADAAIAAGTQVVLSTTTAGRVAPIASAAITDAEASLGQAFDAAGAGADVIRVLVSLG
jgi:hypothetical protein